MKAKRRSDIGEAVYVLFVPRPGNLVTPTITIINLAVFLLMAVALHRFISFSAQDLLAWGANYGPLVTHGQWFRIITCIFVHVGLMHLVMNMYGLVIVAPFLEFALGWTKVAVAYLLAGIAASITSLIVHPATVSAGASGAIFGLFGMFLVLLVIRNLGRAGVVFPIFNFMIFIALNLLIGAKKVGIDNAAHIGGLSMGLILGGTEGLLEVAKSRAHKSEKLLRRRMARARK
jgi:rhomboid protease GluP